MTRSADAGSTESASRGDAGSDDESTLPLPHVCAGTVSQSIFRVARLHKMLAGRLLRRVGLHPGQEVLMMHLWQAGPRRQTDLIELLGSDSATMTRMVRRLEQAGFVRREPCPDDRRAVIVSPTKAGLALRGEVERIWTELEEKTVAGLGEEEQRTARKLLDDLERNLLADYAEAE